jgi:histone H3/H4
MTPPATSIKPNAGAPAKSVKPEPGAPAKSIKPDAGAPDKSIKPEPGEPTAPAAPVKRKRGSAKKSFDAYLRGRRGGSRPDMFIPKLSFLRLVQEIAATFKSDLRFQQEAVNVLQETAEGLVVERFKKCARIAGLCRMDTVRSEHWNFVRQEEEEEAVPCLGRS